MWNNKSSINSCYPVWVRIFQLYHVHIEVNKQDNNSCALFWYQKAVLKSKMIVNYVVGPYFCSCHLHILEQVSPLLAREHTAMYGAHVCSLKPRSKYLKCNTLFSGHAIWSWKVDNISISLSYSSYFQLFHIVKKRIFHYMPSSVSQDRLEKSSKKVSKINDQMYPTEDLS